MHIRRMAAFTLIELVVIMLLVGILAVVAIPRMADRSAFDEMGFHDQVLATLQYARKLAVASRRNVCVSIDVTGVALSQDPNTPESVVGIPNCTLPVALPGASGGGCATNQVCPPSGVSLGATVGSLSFSPLGRPSAGATISVSGQADITIEAETGYVH